MSDGCTIGFDENDDVVIDDIPDDLMQMLRDSAAANRRTVEDEMRSILTELFASDRNGMAGNLASSTARIL